MTRLYDSTQIYFPHNVDFRGRAYPMPQLGNLKLDLSSA